MDNERWAQLALRPALASLAEFTELAAELASRIEDGTIVLTEEEKRCLFQTLRAFEVQSDRLRLELPGSLPAHRRPRQMNQGLRMLS